MNIKIITPDTTVFDGEAYGLQLPGLTGSFELLENHAPMVAALGEGPLKILKDQSGAPLENYTLSGGILEMNVGNQAVVLAEHILKKEP